MLQFKKGSKAHLGWSWHGFPLPHIPHIFSVFFCYFVPMNSLSPTSDYLGWTWKGFPHPYFWATFVPTYALLSFSDYLCWSWHGFPPTQNFLLRLLSYTLAFRGQCWKDTNTMLEGYTKYKFLTSKENALYLYHVEPVLNALVATQVEFAILWHMGWKGYSNLDYNWGLSNIIPGLFIARTSSPWSEWCWLWDSLSCSTRKPPPPQTACTANMNVF